jgi:murein DD-endopeptidase MepM/ murein hydrolase activator NlpD
MRPTAPVSEASGATLRPAAVTRRVRLAHVVIAIGLAASCSRVANGVSEQQAARHQDIVLASETTTIEARVSRDTTLESLLRQYDLPKAWSSSLVSVVRRVFDPRGLRANQPYRLIRALDGRFRELQYRIDAGRLLRASMSPGRDGTPPEFTAEVVPYPRSVVVGAVSTEITRERSSIVTAIGGTGQTVQLALLVADVFGGLVDFNADLQPGDHLDVLFERVRENDEFVGYGDVQAAVLLNKGRRLTAIRYQVADGKPDWYDEQGRSLKRQFLRSPLRLDPDPRVTSRFSYNRLNPVNGGYRAHLGVDYGAAYGAPVIAVASGTVQIAGWAGEAGRLVEIRHAGGYETEYLHLSSFAPGIHPGAHVDQGQLIGHVGSSGTATGPHLDYRIRKRGTYVNPLIELSRMPAGEPIPADRADAFAHERDRVLEDLHGRVSGHAGPPPDRH